MAPLPCLASSCATSTSTAATPALMDGKNDGLSFENGNTQSACSAMGETLLSVRAITRQPASLAVFTTRMISWEYGSKLTANRTSLGPRARNSISRAPASPRINCTEERNSLYR